MGLTLPELPALTDRVYVNGDTVWFLRRILGGIIPIVPHCQSRGDAKELADDILAKASLTWR